MRPKVLIPAKPTPPAVSWWCVPPDQFADAQGRAQTRMSQTSANHTNYDKPTGGDR